MSARVTIGLCTKDSETTIRQTIESIINQTYPKELIQLIVVDGHSKDKTLSIINSATSKTGRAVETYTDKGEGLGFARQIVVNKALGKYVIFVDSDVVLFSDFIRNDVKFMEENPDIVVAFGVSIVKDGTVRERTLIGQVSDLAASALDKSSSVACEATIFRSAALRKVGGFDTKIKGAAEDKDLIARIRQLGMHVSVNETARFLHKYRDTLRASWAEASWMGYGDHYFYHKHGSMGTFWRRFPAGAFVFGLKIASKSYKRTYRKLSFLILPRMILLNIAWWAGFAKGHKYGYGHENFKLKTKLPKK
jgi:glycosyltransferase involved in cell wall biosynthesis